MEGGLDREGGEGPPEELPWGERLLVATGEGLKVITQQSFLFGGQVVHGALSTLFHWTVEPGYATTRRARAAAASMVGGWARQSQGHMDHLSSLLHSLEDAVAPTQADSGGGSGAEASEVPVRHDGAIGGASTKAGGAAGERAGDGRASGGFGVPLTPSPTNAVSGPAVLGRWSPGLIDELRLATLTSIDAAVAGARRVFCGRRDVAAHPSPFISTLAAIWSCAWMARCCRRRRGHVREAASDDGAEVPPLPPSTRRAMGQAAPPTRQPASSSNAALQPGSGRHRRHGGGAGWGRRGVYGHGVPLGEVGCTSSRGGDGPRACGVPHATMGSPAAVFWPMPSISNASASCAIIDNLCGHPVQTYAVTTVDGYILTLIRIPRIDSRKVVFFQHGLLDSASAWVSTGNVHSLASRAYAAGFDVFLGNLRGSNDALGVNGIGANPADYGEELEREQAASSSNVAAAAVASMVQSLQGRGSGRLDGRGPSGMPASASMTSLRSLREVEEDDDEASSSNSSGEESGSEGGEGRMDGANRPPSPVASPAPSAGCAMTPTRSGVSPGVNGGVGNREVMRCADTPSPAPPLLTAMPSTVPSFATPLRGADARARSMSTSSLDTAATGRTYATSATTSFRFVGSTDGIPVHQTLHPRQPEYWNYDVQDHALDVSAFVRHIRIIKALEAHHRQPATTTTTGPSTPTTRPSTAAPATASPSRPPSTATPAAADTVGSGEVDVTMVHPSLTSPHAIDAWAERVLRVNATNGDDASDASAPAVDGVDAVRELGQGHAPSTSASADTDDIGAAADAAGGLTRFAMTLSLLPQDDDGGGGVAGGDEMATPLVIPVSRIGLATREDVLAPSVPTVDDMMPVGPCPAPHAPVHTDRVPPLPPSHPPTRPGSRASPAPSPRLHGSSTAATVKALGVEAVTPLPASGSGDDDGEGTNQWEGWAPGIVDATHPAADDVSIIGVGHSMGGCVLMLYSQMCKALGRPHWLDRLILLSPAGYHREIMKPAKWLLLALYHAGVLNAERPFPMRSSFMQRLVARFMQDLKRTQATSDLVGLVGSMLIGGDRSKFVFRYVSFTDYPIGGSAHKVLRHGIQNFRAQEFQTYDYGQAENMRRYGTAEPPSFRRDFGLLDIPMHFVAGGRDALIPIGNIVETFQLLRRLHPASTTLHIFPTAGHLDFTLTLADDIITHVINAMEVAPHTVPGTSGITQPAASTALGDTGSDVGMGGRGGAVAATTTTSTTYGIDNIPQRVVNLAEAAAARISLAPTTYEPALRTSIERFPWLAGFSKLEAVLDGLHQEAVEMGLVATT